jgi:hypothetical protein
MTPLLLPAAFRSGQFLVKLVLGTLSLLALTPCVQNSPAASEVSSGNPAFPMFRSGDVVAFIGGENVAAQKESGHLETLLSLRFPGVTFRNLGWEGDTVFTQPRDVGFPDLLASLKSARATVVVAQFGRTEALGGGDVKEFARSYAKLLKACSAAARKVVLVAPPPYENGGGLLPDLSARNTNLAAYVEAIHNLAREHQLPVVDLFAEFDGLNHHEQRLTGNGLQLTVRGQGFIALAFARQMGLSKLAEKAGEPAQNGAWPDVRMEQLRQQILAKDTLWFDYYRPQNWAFLGGDRVSQPSSRDHLNPAIRWFPSEMEKFIPLIHEKEQGIEKLASSLR